MLSGLFSDDENEILLNDFSADIGANKTGGQSCADAL